MPARWHMLSYAMTTSCQCSTGKSFRTFMSQHVTIINTCEGDSDLHSKRKAAKPYGNEQLYSGQHVTPSTNGCCVLL